MFSILASTRYCGWNSRAIGPIFSVLFPKNKQLSKRNRKFRPLIGIENGGLMLLSRAHAKVDAGRAIIVNGLVRFLKEDPHPGYDAAPEYVGFRGRQSYDPERGGGPQTVQFFRAKFEL